MNHDVRQDRKGRVLDLFLTFLRFGCFTFGGGWSIVAQIQKEYVEKKRWITDEELLDFTSVARSMPGLMIGNVSVLFGYQCAGVPGAAAALIGMVIPPVFVMLLVTTAYAAFRDHPLVSRAMAGVRAAVVPIIVSALLKLLKAGIRDLPGILIAAAAFALCLSGRISNVLIVLIGAAAGLLIREVKTRAGA